MTVLARSVVYTAIFGGYDDLHQPVEQDSDCDFVCFTDQILPDRVGAWYVVGIARNSGLHPRMDAKRFKLLSHEVLREGRLSVSDPLRWPKDLPEHRYALSIWIDGSIAIKSSSFVRDVAPTTAAAGWSMFSHPDRDCIFEEVSASLPMEKYKSLRLQEQVAAYRERGFQEHAGLWACTIIARSEPLNPQLQRVNDLWWQENLKWTYQDQLSLPYVLRMTGAKVGVIPGNLWKNQWFDFHRHNSNK